MRKHESVQELAARLGVRLPSATPTVQVRGSGFVPSSEVAKSEGVRRPRKVSRARVPHNPAATRAKRQDNVATIAARRTGLGLEAYAARIAAGEKWCVGHKAWHDRSAFGRDATRASGLSASCLPFRREDGRRRYQRRSA